MIIVRRHLPLFVLCWAMLCLGAQGAEMRDTAERQGLRFFETKIRPLLADRCYGCHGESVQESELRLDSYAGMLDGGAAGTSVVPGKPQQSLLLTAVSYRDADLQMPPEDQLSEQEVADLRHWVEIGAPHPQADDTAPKGQEKVDWEAAEEFWAFQPPRRVPLPQVSDTSWISTPIDQFILAELERRELTPAPPADRRTWLRRVTLDLTGLPPTPAEVKKFVQDRSPDSYARVVDRLLSSAHYGERWGRHWLDVARYADSNGLDENIAHGNAWRYRDYVIEAFNSDKPFNQFVVEQLAGDLLPPADNQQLEHERLIATGFLSLGPKVLAEGDEKKMVMDIVDEQIDTFGRTLLGITMGCARCHDHKFDPIGTRDYYALAGIFKSTRTMESTERIARWHENPIATDKQLREKEQHEQRIEEQKASIQQVIDQANEALLAQRRDGAELPEDPESQYPDEVKQQLKQLRDELAKLEDSAPELPTAMGVTEGEVADVPIHVRGSHLTLGESVPRAVPRALSFDGQPAFDHAHSGRLELAHWLVRPENPLAARVFVNRVWRWHFGEGLVASPDNFGKLGARPTNQPLLDWLAVEFVEQGWSIKRLHRMILLSSTYRMSSNHDAANARIDSQNQYQWRHNIQRMEAEVVRDSLLAVSGLLQKTMGGSLLHVGNREFIFNHTSKDETNYDAPRRSVYLPVIRNHLYDVFQLFDYTGASVPNGDRPTSTVAPQALFMMNSDFMARASEALAERLEREAEADSEKGRIRRLYLLALGRPPGEQEIELAQEFVERVARDPALNDSDARRSAWAALCQVVLASNEFVHIR